MIKPKKISIDLPNKTSSTFRESSTANYRGRCSNMKESKPLKNWKGIFYFLQKVSNPSFKSRASRSAIEFFIKGKVGVMIDDQVSEEIQYLPRVIDLVYVDTVEARSLKY